MDDLLIDLAELRIIVAELADQPIYALTDETLLAFHDMLQVAINDLMAYDAMLTREIEQQGCTVLTASDA